jgi:multiple sugar transport system ATP-binding protein
MGLYTKPVNMFVAGFIGTPAMNFVDATLVKTDGRYAVDAGSFKVLIPESKKGNDWDKYVGKQIVFGVRPEDIFDKVISMVPPTEENTIKATVDVIEPMGAIVQAYLTSGKHALVATIDAETKMKEDQEMEFVLDMEKTHVFDKDTEQAIY